MPFWNRHQFRRQLPIDTPSSNGTAVDHQPILSHDPGRSVAIRIAETIADTPASNTLVLDVHEISPFTDYFVICSGENERQLRAIQREVVDRLAKAGTRPDRMEGNSVGGWIVLDYGDVVVHVFSADLRDYYRLEELWQDAPTVLAIQ